MRVIFFSVLAFFIGVVVSFQWKGVSQTLSDSVLPEAKASEGAGYAPVITPGGKTLQYTLDGNVKVFRLTANRVTREWNDPTKADGSRRKIVTYGYNGSMPGPTIEVVQGDTVRIEFTNQWPEPTTVHWHGIELPNSMDGGSSFTQSLVKPGESFTYEFTLHQAPGTYMYHSGHMQALQVGMGSSGFFIIHPKGREASPVDRDYAIMLQTWTIPPHGNIPDTASMNFNYFTMNGLPGPDVPWLKVKKGERVRIRLGNLSMMSHPIHLHGFTFEVMDMGGGYLAPAQRWPSNTMSINAGEARAIEFTAHTIGKWMFHCHFLHHIMNDMEFLPIPGQPHGMAHLQGMFTIVEVSK